MLGHREEAIREGRAALDQRPPERDGFEGTLLGLQYAAILALAGDRPAAINLLEKLSTYSLGPCYQNLCLDPDWDTLRGDPRFEGAAPFPGPQALIPPKRRTKKQEKRGPFEMGQIFSRFER